MNGASERRSRYADLHRTTAGLLYLRNKTAGEALRVRAEMGRVRDEARAAARRGDDGVALRALTRLRELDPVLVGLEHEIAERGRDAEEGKRTLVRLADEIRRADRASIAGALRADLDALSASAEVELDPLEARFAEKRASRSRTELDRLRARPTGHSGFA